jgi:hypothetical protein
MLNFPAKKIVGGIGADDEYWNYLAAGEFRLPQCSGCGKWIWPAHFRCGACGSWEIGWTKVDPVGTVHSWTRTYYAWDRTPERAADVPYSVVLAEIPSAGGVRVFGALIGSEENLRIDAPVRGVIQPPSPKSKDYPSVCWQIDG